MPTLAEIHDHVRAPLAKKIVGRFIDRPEQAAVILLENCAFMGGSEDLDSGDFVEGLALDFERFLEYRPGDPARRQAYVEAFREIVLVFGYGPDELGYKPDDPDENEEGA